jgi:phosphatidylserine decarboxylase
MGRLSDYEWPEGVGRAVVNLYCRAYKVELEECMKASGFASFDEFFTRELRAGARPLPDDPSVVASPADGRVDSLGPVDGRSFHVKGRPYRVDELVGDAEEARRYEGGQGCVVYLSPRDYHRVHAPAGGDVRVVRSMPGDYFPVNAIGVRHVENLFTRNRRVAIAIDTPESSGLGRVTVVMVAAMVVGRITVTGFEERDVPLGAHHVEPPVTVRQGDEIGIFRLGSTAVVFFEPGADVEWLVGEGPIRYGQPLARSRSRGGRGGERGENGGGANGRRGGRGRTRRGPLVAVERRGHRRRGRGLRLHGGHGRRLVVLPEDDVVERLRHGRRDLDGPVAAHPRAPSPARAAPCAPFVPASPPRRPFAPPPFSPRSPPRPPRERLRARGCP